MIEIFEMIVLILFGAIGVGVLLITAILLIGALIDEKP